MYSRMGGDTNEKVALSPIAIGRMARSAALLPIGVDVSLLSCWTRLRNSAVLPQSAARLMSLRFPAHDGIRGQKMLDNQPEMLRCSL